MLFRLVVALVSCATVPVTLPNGLQRLLFQHLELQLEICKATFKLHLSSCDIYEYHLYSLSCPHTSMHHLQILIWLQFQLSIGVRATVPAKEPCSCLASTPARFCCVSLCISRPSDGKSTNPTNTVGLESICHGVLHEATRAKALQFKSRMGHLRCHYW